MFTSYLHLIRTFFALHLHLLVLKTCRFYQVRKRVELQEKMEQEEAERRQFESEVQARAQAKARELIGNE